MRTRVLLVASIVVVTLLGAVTVVAVHASNEGAAVLANTSAGGARTLAASGRSPSLDGYPADVVEGARLATSGLFTGDPVVFQEHDDAPPLYARRADLVAQFTALTARARELPYRDQDLLVPVRNGGGTLVGYLLANVGLLTPQQVAEPGFDICTVELDALERARVGIAALEASQPEEYARWEVPPVPTHLQAGCAPRR